MKTRNNAVTIWRIVFTYLIMIYHFDNKYGISTRFNLTIGWYIGVEFFFIVSGYLLYDQLPVLAEKCHSGWAYFVYRFKKLYPYYLGAFLLSLISCYITGGISVKDVVRVFLNKYFELFALHGIGLDEGWSNLNNTSWYFSIMLISGLIIYHCLLKWEDNFVNFVSPLIIIVCFSYLYRNMDGIGAVVQIDGLYNNQPLMRGLAGMCLGIMAKKLNNYIRLNCNSTGWLRLLGNMGFIFVILCSLKYGNSTRDFLYTIILTVSVGIAFLPSESKIFNMSFIHKLSKITMCMYFIHDAFRTFIFPYIFGFPTDLKRIIVLLLLYLVAVTICAFLFDILIKWTVKNINSLFRKITS